MRKLAAAILLFCMAAAAAEIQPSVAEGLLPAPVGLFFLCDQDGASLFYRFDGAASLRPLNEVLRLEALPGEERSYVIHVEARNSAGLLEVATFSYLIDRRPPAPVRADKPAGTARPGERIALSAQAGDRILYTLLPGQAEPKPYESPVILPGRADEVLLYSLSAVAMDSAGNVSQPLSLAYSVPWGGLVPAQEDKAPPPAAERAGSAGAPILTAISGSASRSVDFSAPGASAFQWAVASPPGRGGPAQGPWQDLAAEAGRARLVVAAPPGWVGTLSFLARAVDASGAFSPPSAALALSFTDDYSSSAEDPGWANLQAVPLTRSAWFVAGPGPGVIRWRQDGGLEKEYQGPVLLQAPERSTAISLRWYRLLPEGRRSPEKILSVPMPPDPGLPAIEGVPSLGVSSNAITVTPSSSSIVLRYEISRMGNEPPPVTASSPVMEGPLQYGADPGATVPYRMRLRSFSGREASASASDERVYSFTVDRTPPSPPRVEEFPAPQGETAKYFGFANTGDEVYWRLYREGVAQGSWRRFGAPVRLEPDEEGPVSYALSAYAVDMAGNRSAESERVTVTLDAMNVYAAEGGNDKADGSPTSPVHSLEMAIRIAAATGRKSIRLRGKVRQGADISITSDLEIDGGFGADWKPDSAARAELSLRSLDLVSGTLKLSRVDVSSASRLAFPFSRLRSGRLEIRDSSLSLQSSAEEVIAIDEGATLMIEDSALSIDASGKVTGIVLSGAALESRNSSFSLSGADIGTALAIHGGRALISGTRLSCSSALSTAAIQAEEAQLELSRSILLAEASGGFASCLMSRDSSVKMRDSVIGSSRSTEAVLIDISGGYLSLLHVTAFLRDSSRLAIGLRSQGIQVEARNSAFVNFATSAQSALFDGRPDAKAMQAFWQGGFASLLRQDARELYAGRVFSAESAALFGFDSKGMPRLGASSPLIDRGVPTGEGVDWYGNPRPSRYGKGLPDVGAFEYQ